MSYHVLDIHGLQIFTAETLDRAREMALQAISIKLNGCTVYHIEKRDRVWTSATTLGDALRGGVVESADHDYRGAATGRLRVRT